MEKNRGLFYSNVYKIKRTYGRWLKRNSIAAEDVVTQAFYMAWQWQCKQATKNNGIAPYSFGSYIYHNIKLAIKFYRTKQDIQLVESFSPMIEDKNTEKAQQTTEIMEEIDMAVQKTLNDKQRLLFANWCDNEFNVVKTAKAMKMPEAGTFVSVGIMRKRLQEFLANRLPLGV